MSGGDMRGAQPLRALAWQRRVQLGNHDLTHPQNVSCLPHFGHRSAPQ